jgi:hypothetical protein
VKAHHAQKACLPAHARGLNEHQAQLGRMVQHPLEETPLIFEVNELLGGNGLYWLKDHGSSCMTANIIFDCLCANRIIGF